MKKILLALILIILLPLSGLAAPPSNLREVILDQMVEVDFDPVQAFFLVALGEDLTFRLKAQLVPLAPGAGTDLRRFLAGAKLRIPIHITDISFSLLLAGGGERYHFIPSGSRKVSEIDPFGNDLNRLKATVQERQEVEAGWRRQLSVQQENLKRLQSDADLIGHFDRILDVQDELKKIEKESAALDRDIANMNEFFSLAKSRPEPRNYARRELELTQQLVQLASAAKAAEDGEKARRSEDGGESSQEARPDESFAPEDIDILQERLIQLRRRRMELERRFGSPADIPEVNTEADSRL